MLFIFSLYFRTFTVVQKKKIFSLIFHLQQAWYNCFVKENECNTLFEIGSKWVVVFPLLKSLWIFYRIILLRDQCYDNYFELKFLISWSVEYFIKKCYIMYIIILALYSYYVLKWKKYCILHYQKVLREMCRTSTLWLAIFVTSFFLNFDTQRLKLSHCILCSLAHYIQVLTHTWRFWVQQYFSKILHVWIHFVYTVVECYGLFIWI